MKKVLTCLFMVCMLLVTLVLTSCAGFFEEETLIIESVKATTMDDGRTKITISYVDDVQQPLEFFIPQGEQGVQGEQGIGIENIEYKPLSNGNTLITITVTDNVIDPVIFEVKNGVKILDLKEGTNAISGEKYIFFEYNDGTYSKEIYLPSGKDGVGIKTYSTTENPDGGYNLQIVLDDERTIDVVIPGPEKGEAGVGIDIADGKQGIVGSMSADGSKYVLTVYYTDGTSQAVEFTRPKEWLWSSGRPDDKTGVSGDYCFDTVNNDIYVKRGSKWTNIFDMDSVEEKHTVKFNINAFIYDEEKNEYVPDESAKLNGLDIWSDLKHGAYFTDNPGCEIPVPTRTGYTFKGWYTSKVVTEVTGKFTTLTVIVSDLELFALWEKDVVIP